MTSDTTTTIQDLKSALRTFTDEREWSKFHDPKNLAEAISVEASELMELFLWKTPTEIRETLRADRGYTKAVQGELADVICFSLSLANSLEIDVSKCVRQKMLQNSRKYPVAKARGVATKYTNL